MVFSSFKAMAEQEKQRKLKAARYNDRAAVEGMDGVLSALESDIISFVGHAVRALQATGIAPKESSDKIGEITGQMAEEFKKYFS